MSLREKVDQYIQERIDEELNGRIKEMFDGLLVQEFRKYMQRKLDEYIQDMIRNSLDAALDELYSEFDLDSSQGGQEGGQDAESENKADPPMVSLDERQENDEGDEPRVLYGLREDDLAFLAYCQYYKEHTGQNPRNRKLSEVFKEGPPSAFRARLIEKGWMTKDVNFSNGRVIDYPLSRRIPNPEEVLKSYFDSENEWRQQEDPDYA